MRARPLLVSMVLGVSCPALPALAVERGAWFYYISSEPHGAANIIGNAAKEDEAIRFMQQWEIKRLYGSYSTLTTNSPSAMAAWNKKLAQAGINSYVEISGASNSLPQNQPALMSLVDDRLINFNAARSDPQERFVGIEMDIEPWTTSQWSGSTTTQRRDMLLELRDAFANVRQRTHNAGLTSAKLSAALPIFFDTTATIAWTNQAEIDQWFSDIGGSLNEVSFMPYETNSVTTIMNRVSYELSHFPGTSYVALRTRLDLEWASMAQFTSAMTGVEQQSGHGIDIESYYRLRNALALPWDNGSADATWATPANWGMDIGPIDVNYATFSSTTPGVIGTVNLGGVSRPAGSVVFSNPSGSYTLSNGTILTPFVTQTTNVTNVIDADVRTTSAAMTIDVQAGTIDTARSLGVSGDTFAINKIGGGTLLAKQISAGALTVTQGTVRLKQSPANGETSRATAVSIATGAKLDLTNNHLIVTAQSAGSWNGTHYTGVSGLIETGRNGGAWNGSGIVTTTPATPGNSLKTLAVATAAQAGTTTFGGISVAPSDVLIMYAFAGDANLCGHVDADDYFQIDSHYGKSDAANLGYFNGDFNYSGMIDGDDYFLLDSAFAGPGGAILAVGAVPEPSASISAGLAVLFACRRARRRY